ncbi:TatD DNase [Ascosphaera atra]|nr:TatD DNase [Ascosphaera atra]
MAEQQEPKKLRYADVAINLGDPIFTGVYHSKKAHDDDLEDIIQRALDVGCEKLMLTGSDLKESQHVVDMAKAHRKFNPAVSIPGMI